MKIKISKSQWEGIGKKAGWISKPENKNIKVAKVDVEEIIKSIMEKRNQYFSYRHFCASNMADYSLMSSTIEDLASVYGINEIEAGEIVQKLTHNC